MSVVLLCANAAEAARYPAWPNVVAVSNWRSLEGQRMSAVFATPAARNAPDYLMAAPVAIRNVAAMIEETYSIPQVFMAGGEIPSELVRVA